MSRNFDQIMRSKETDSWSKTLSGVNTSGTFSIPFLPSTSKEQLFLNSLSIYNNVAGASFDISAGTIAGSSILYQMGLNTGVPYQENLKPILTTIGTVIQLNIYGLSGTFSCNMVGYTIRKSGELFITNSDFEFPHTCDQGMVGTCTILDIPFGWSGTSAGGNMGIVRWNNSSYGTTQFFPSEYPNQYLYINAGQQTFVPLPYRLEKNFLYNLEVTCLNRNQNLSVRGYSPEHHVLLLAGTTVLVQHLEPRVYPPNVPTPDFGGTTRHRLSYLSDANSPELGKNIKIQLISVDTQTGFDDLSLIAYDKN